MISQIDIDHYSELGLPQPQLPANAIERKGIPITTGVLDYFPLALMEVARCSKAGNDQHNPGKPLHWAKHLRLVQRILQSC